MAPSILQVNQIRQFHKESKSIRVHTPLKLCRAASERSVPALYKLYVHRLFPAETNLHFNCTCTFRVTSSLAVLKQKAGAKVGAYQ